MMTEQTTANPNALQTTLPNEPPPAYENDQTTEINSQNESSIFIEAPPPYFPVDPSKLSSSCELPSYSRVTPIEIIEIQTTNFIENDASNRNSLNNAWFISGSNLNIGSDCTFLLAFLVAFFFNWLGFLIVVCFIPTIAARFGAMSGFGLSVVKWISFIRFHEFRTNSIVGLNHLSSEHKLPSQDPIQAIVFALIMFAGFFLFVRGLVSYIMIKNRARYQEEQTQIFSWY